MAARSTLTVTSGTTITSAWGNSVRDHAVPSTGSDDVATNGQIAVNTTTQRVVIHNGTAATTLHHYGSAGRFTATGVNTGISLLNGLVQPFTFSSSSSAGVAVTNSPAVFTISAGAGGIYAVSARMLATSAFNGDSTFLVEHSGGAVWEKYIPNGQSNGSVSFVAALADGNTVTFSLFNGSTAPRTVSLSALIIRLGA